MPTVSGLDDRVVEALLDAGCAAVGVCGVQPLAEARRVIEHRRSAGLHDTMQFVFRNPARSTDPRRALPSARSALVAALPYPHEHSVAPAEPSARVARYASTELYAQLREILGMGAEMLADEGHRAVVLADDNALVDRAMAVRAGLGWLGRNTNLLVPGTGSWVVIGSILTDADLDARPGSTQRGSCGSCTRCMGGCPTGALVAPGVMDAARCLSWLLQRTGPFPRAYRRALRDRIYGCDECQEVCPPSQVPQPLRARPPEPRTTAPGGWLSLEFLLTADDETLLGRVGSWYIPARDPRYVRRNALVVLGNQALENPSASDDPTLLGLLERWLRCGDDLLVEHAAWAARALGCEWLLDAADVRDLPAVRAERARPHPDAPGALAAPGRGGETGP